MSVAHPPELRDAARALQQRGGLTQAHIGARLGVHQVTISRWLNPRTPKRVNPDQATIALGVHLDNGGPALPLRHVWGEPVRDSLGPGRFGNPTIAEVSLDAAPMDEGRPLYEWMGSSALDPAEMVERGEIV